MSYTGLCEGVCQCQQKEDAAAAVTNLELHFTGVCYFLSAKNLESHFMSLRKNSLACLAPVYVHGSSWLHL